MPCWPVVCPPVEPEEPPPAKVVTVPDVAPVSPMQPVSVEVPVPPVPPAGPPVPPTEAPVPPAEPPVPPAEPCAVLDVSTLPPAPEPDVRAAELEPAERAMKRGKNARLAPRRPVRADLGRRREGRRPHRYHVQDRYARHGRGGRHGDDQQWRRRCGVHDRSRGPARRPARFPCPRETR